MPQIQVYDAAPDPLAQAAGRFGEGFAESFHKRREDEGIGRILEDVKEGDSDQDIMKKVFGAKGVSFERKEKLSNAISDIRKKAKDVSHMQQLRLARDSIFKQYHSKIKEIDEGLKAGHFKKNERNEMLELRKKLIAERDRLLGTATEASPESPVAKVFSQGAEGQKKRQKFDLKNPEHKARRDAILKATNGNQEKAKAELLKEFE